MIFLWITFVSLLLFISMFNLKPIKQPNFVAFYYILIFVLYGYASIFSLNINFEGLITNDVKIKYLTSILLMLVIMTFFSFIFRYKIKIVNEVKKYIIFDSYKKVFYLIFYLVLFVMLILIIGSGNVQKIILLITRQVDTKIYWELRNEKYSSFNANTVKLLTMFLNIFQCFIISWSLIKWKESKIKRYKNIFIILVIISIIYGLVDLHKSIILKPFIILVFYFYLYKFANFKNKAYVVLSLIIGVAIFTIGLLPLAYTIQYPQFTFLDGINASLNRIFFETNRVLQLHFAFYPKIHPYLNGASMSFLGKIFYITDESISPLNYIPSYFDKTQSSWNACYIGDAWADFGYLGVIIYSIIVLLYFIWMLNQVKKIKYNDFKLACNITVCYMAIYFSGVGIGTALNTFGLFWFGLFIKIVNISQVSFCNVKKCDLVDLK